MTRQGSPRDQRPALQEAMSHLRQGRLDDAEPVLRRILAVQPDQPDALHLLGLWHHERNDPDEALRLIRKAIRVWPDDDPQVCVAWNNLGNVLVESTQPQAAVDAYRSALVAQPAASGTWNNLAALLRRLGRGDEAEQAAQHAVAAAPDDAQAWFTLARVQVELGKVYDGLQAHARGVVLAPRDRVGREQVLRSLAVLGHRDEAAMLWREQLQDCPDDPVSQHHEAACVGRPLPRASEAYVETVFDGFASTFDAKLAKLQYRAPELIVAALDELNRSGVEWGTVADIGCGTGLLGVLLRPHVRRLVGADLSPAMLEHARRRGVYHELTHMDLLAFLRAATACFDAIVAADVLCYFGVLDDVAAVAVEALRPGGVFVFTVEAQADADPGDWSLCMTGRYSHSPGYIATVMADFDDVTIRHCALRMEAGLPVDGLLVTGRHP